MNAALALARQGEGLTRPNPPVGAVVVKQGEIVGQGWHKQAGLPHAEVLALRAAAKQAQGAVLYVTLEPCSTQGRTPPCTQAILAAGIQTVVVAVRDPNPLHRGKGLKQLRDAGVEVIENILQSEAADLIAPFAKWIKFSQPYVTLKMAVTLDGKIADHNGLSRWITGASARNEVQALRRRADAVLVGAGTARADNPALLPRPAKGRQPWRVILDSRGTLSGKAKVFQPPQARQTIIATTGLCPLTQKETWLAAGASVWVLPEADQKIALDPLFKKLGSIGVLHVLCEGGGILASSLVESNLVDEYVFFVAPRLLGGQRAPGAIGGQGWPLASAPALRFTGCRPVGEDLMLKAKPKKKSRKK